MKDKYEDKYDIPERILFMALESVLFDEEQANSLMWVISISVPNREYFQGIHVGQSHYSKSQIFVQKFNFDFPRKLSIFGVKTRENVVVLDFLALDFDFTRKNVKNIWVKTRENVFCQNWFFGQKFDF